MGCGRSRHSSPTLTADALAFKGDNKENRRGGKRQKLSDKNNSKAGGCSLALCRLVLFSRPTNQHDEVHLQEVRSRCMSGWVASNEGR